MGRGLSDLQRTILKLAAARGTWEKPATYRDILIRYFKKVLPVGRTTVKHYRDYRRDEQYEDRPRWFDEEAIGLARYRAALASISRACARLERRGLIRWGDDRFARKAGGKLGRAVRLTKAGRELLSVKKLEHFNR